MRPKKAPSQTIERFKGKYSPPRMDKLSMRSGAMDILKAPSRISKTLFYPDGTTKKEIS